MYRTSLSTIVVTVLSCLVLGSAWAASEEKPGFLDSARLAAPNSPISNHWVTTLLGPTQRVSLNDWRLDATITSLADYGFLPNGEMLVLDSGTSRIFRVGADGLLRPFAGNGDLRRSGDSGAALSAGLQIPHRLAVSPNGIVYVQQQDGYIREIAVDGIIRTVGGTGSTTACPTDGALFSQTPVGVSNSLSVDAQGRLYFAPSSCGVHRVEADGRVRRMTGVDASISSVDDITVNELGVVYFSAVTDSLRMLYRIAADGVVSVAMNPRNYTGQREGSIDAIQIANIQSIVVGPDGRTYIASGPSATSMTPSEFTPYELGVVDTSRKYSILLATDGYAGNPTGTIGTTFVAPTRIRLGQGGQVFFKDRISQALLQLQSNDLAAPYMGQFERTYGVTEGSTPVLSSSFLSNLAVDAQNRITVGSSDFAKLFRLDSAGSLAVVAGNASATGYGDGGPAIAARLASGAFAQDADGNIYLSELRQKGGASLTTVFRKISADGVIAVVLGGGEIAGEWDGLDGLAVDLGRYADVYAVSPAGVIYFTHRSLSGVYTIWKRGLDGKLVQVAGKGSSATSASLETGKPALEIALPNITRLSVDTESNLYFQAAFTGGYGMYRIDDEGLVRSVIDPNLSVAFSDGSPTRTAPGLLSGVAFTGAKRFLASHANAGLAQYIADGATTVWADAADGRVWNEGLRLSENAKVGTYGTVPLADGSIAWIENRLPYSHVRRSIPVPAGCQFIPSVSSLNVYATGGITEISLNTAESCTWAIGSSSHWIGLSGKTSGKSSANIPLRFKANPSAQPREGFLYVAGHRITVTQAGNDEAEVFSISPREVDVPAAGGTFNVNIMAGPSRNWQFFLPADGVTINGSLTGTGSATRSLTVGAMPTVPSRTLVVRVNDETVTIRQAQVLPAATMRVSTSLAGVKALIDGVEQPLPFEAKWTPGSKHTVALPAILPGTGYSLSQFVGWNDSVFTAEREIVMPVEATAIQATYRELQAVEFNVRENGAAPQANSSVIAKTYEGVEISDQWKQQLGLSPAVRFYPKAESIRVLAAPGEGFEFVRFLITPLGAGGAPTSDTSSLTSISISQALTVRAEFRSSSTLQPAFRAPASQRLRFPGPVTEGNPLSVPVTALDAEQTPVPPGLFVAYEGYSQSEPTWLQTRVSNSGHAPFVLELKVDPNASSLKQSGSTQHKAVVYLQTPNAKPTAVVLTVDTFVGDEDASESQVQVHAVTDGGGFRQAQSASPGSILTLFGVQFSNQTLNAQSVPLPTVLGGLRVQYTRPDTAQTVEAPLFFVSPQQVNLMLPTDLVVPGAGQVVTFTVRAQNGSVTSFDLLVTPQTASLFSADSSGLGAAAGFGIWVAQDGEQERFDLFQCDGGTCQPRTIRVTDNRKQLFLELYGTGFQSVAPENILVYVGGRASGLAYVGPHTQFVGLTQLNVTVSNPATLEGDVDLYVWVRSSENAPWQPSNRLTLRFP